MGCVIMPEIMVKVRKEMYDQQRVNHQANFEPSKHHGRTLYICGDLGGKYGI